VKPFFIVLASPLLLVGVAIFVAAAIVKNRMDGKSNGRAS
jgi:hypothetical protein